MEFLESLSAHPNVCRFFGACYSDSDDKQELLIVTQYYKNGSLYDYIKQRQDESRQIPIQQKYKFMKDAIAGLSHLHRHKVIHRDIAARNFLVTDSLGVVTSDFGLMKETTQFSSTVEKNDKWPVRWIAYESIFDKKHTVESDIWMFGVFMWE
eukprot:UN23421